MRKYSSYAVSVAVILAGWLLVGIGWVLFATVLKSDAKADLPAIVHEPFDSTWLNVQIRNSELAVEGDPNGALGWSLLSSAYLGRSRESDDLATALKAENAARTSLRLRGIGNHGAWNKLAQSLLQQHRFSDALAVCVEAEKKKTSDDQTLRLHAECLLEVGQYSEAKTLIRRSPRAFSGASGTAIQAKLLDIEGEPGRAADLLLKATREAEKISAIPGNALAWFHDRLAMQLTKNEQFKLARHHFQQALRVYPRDYRAMAGLTRVAMEEGEWREAIVWGQRSDEIAQMADIRALVGDAYLQLGDRTQAEKQYERVAELVGRPSGFADGLHEVSASSGSHGHRLDRQYAQFCADHNRDLEGAYAAALRDLESRKDIYGYDTLAWVSFRRGEISEAKAAIERALSTGTKDPDIRGHAALIFRTQQAGVRQAGSRQEGLK